jgi:nucleotide-binding universal stress UspA family protein
VTFRIVVPLDGSRFSEEALPLALALAEATGGSLELISVAVPLQPPLVLRGDLVVGEDALDRGIGHAESHLAEVSERIQSAGVGGFPLETHVFQPGNSARSIVRHLTETEADLVVMTTHGRGPLQRAWLGSTADGVIRRSPCPVLLLRPEDRGPDAPPPDLTQRPAPFRRVLLPLDGSEAAERAFDPLPKILEAGAAIRLHRVVPPFVVGGSPYIPHAMREAEDHEAVRRASLEYLERLIPRFQAPGFAIDTEVITAGQPALAILQSANEEGMDLISMSTSGRGGAARLLLGSVADKVVRGALCPVLLSRTPEDV